MWKIKFVINIIRMKGSRGVYIEMYSNGPNSRKSISHDIIHLCICDPKDVEQHTNTRVLSVAFPIRIDISRYTAKEMRRRRRRKKSAGIIVRLDNRCNALGNWKFMSHIHGICAYLPCLSPSSSPCSDAHIQFRFDGVSIGTPSMIWNLMWIKRAEHN